MTIPPLAGQDLAALVANLKVEVSPITQAEWDALINGERRRNREAVRAVVNAVRNSDAEAFLDAVAAGEHLDIWGTAWRAIARLDPPSAQFRRVARRLWVSWGDGLRSRSNDLDMIPALRVLLPPYRGTGRVLYRGDGFHNRRHRTYGLSWTTRLDVAQSFARGPYQTSRGGSVLLQADAPPAAIISAIPAADDRYGENEVLVDRRALKAVRVIERFPQRDIASSGASGDFAAVGDQPPSS